MKSYVFLLAVLQALGCSGMPMLNTEAMSERALTAAMVEVNSMYAVNNLYRPTRATVTRIVPLGLNINDLMMTFAIKETDCTKASRSDPQTCAFKPGFFVPTFTCSGRVRVSSGSNQVISVKCGHDGSSSEESSEEAISRGRHHFTIPLSNRALAATAPPPPAQPGISVLNQPAVRLRGDGFNNYLE